MYASTFQICRREQPQLPKESAQPQQPGSREAQEAPQPHAKAQDPPAHRQVAHGGGGFHAAAGEERGGRAACEEAKKQRLQQPAHLCILVRQQL